MRLISQKGDLDIPYEEVIVDVLEIWNCETMVGYNLRASFADGCVYTLGKYETKDRAIVEMLRIAHYYENGDRLYKVR